MRCAYCALRWAALLLNSARSACRIGQSLDRGIGCEVRLESSAGQIQRSVLANLKALGLTVVQAAHRPQPISLATRVYDMTTLSFRGLAHDAGAAPLATSASLETTAR